MRVLELAKGGPVLLDDADFDNLPPYAIYIDANGYPSFSVWPTGPVLLHLYLVGGAVPSMHVDHENGDKLDCQRHNLRVVTPQVNQINRKRLNKNNSTGARGVTFRRRSSRFIAQIMVDGRGIYLGSYLTLEEAVTARKNGERQYFPEMCP